MQTALTKHQEYGAPGLGERLINTKDNDLKEIIRARSDAGVRCALDEQEIDRFLGWCDQELEALDKDRDATLHDELTWKPKCNKATLR